MGDDVLIELTQRSFVRSAGCSPGGKDVVLLIIIFINIIIIIIIMVTRFP